MTQGRPSEAETLGAPFRIFRRKAERSFLALITLPADGVSLARTLSALVALANAILTLKRTACTTTAGSASRITVISFGTTFASEAVETVSAEALTIYVALRSR